MGTCQGTYLLPGGPPVCCSVWPLTHAPLFTTAARKGSTYLQHVLVEAIGPAPRSHLPLASRCPPLVVCSPEGRHGGQLLDAQGPQF